MMDNNSRRKFLVICLGVVTKSFGAVVLWPVYRYLAPRAGTSAAARVVIPEKDVAEGEAKFFEFAGSSAVLVRKRGGELIALSAVCTHLGCIVQWEKDKQSFLCPCHAGHYTPDGAVTAGPPPKPLAKLPFSVANGAITIG
jgi:cytochrome b6-f complex iron-sulfur subunit